MLYNVYSKFYVLNSKTRRETIRIILYDRFLRVLEESSVQDKPIVEIPELNYAYSMDMFTAYQFGLSSGTNFIQDVEERTRCLQPFLRSRRRYRFFTTETPGLLASLARFGIRLVPRGVDKATADLEQWNLKRCDEAEVRKTDCAEAPAGLLL